MIARALAPAALALLLARAAVAADAGVVDAGAAAAAVDPDAPTVAASVDRADAHVGDPIRISVITVAKTGVPVNLPGTFDLGPFTLLGRDETREQNLGDGRIRREFVLRVAAYEPGEVQLPPIDVTYLGPAGEVKTARTGAVAIKIASLIANEPEPALKDAATPVSVMEENRIPLYVGGALLAAGARRADHVLRRAQAAFPARRASGTAAPARARDRAGAPRSPGRARLPRERRQPALLLRGVGGDPRLPRRALRLRFAGADDRRADRRAQTSRGTGAGILTLGEIQGWLSACDLVKFAKVSPTAAEARGALESAIRIVKATRPAPVAPIVAAGAAPEARHA